MDQEENVCIRANEIPAGAVEAHVRQANFGRHHPSASRRAANPPFIHVYSNIEASIKDERICDMFALFPGCCGRHAKALPRITCGQELGQHWVIVLLEAPFNPSRRQKNSVLLTVDLTKAVADEAIARKDSIIVAYHPIIFRGLKSITLANTQQQSLLRLAAEGISVYSPHTAFDAAPGGLGDWLADIVTGTAVTAPRGDEVEEDIAKTPGDAEADPFVDRKRPVYMLQLHPSQRSIKDADLKMGSTDHTRTSIKPSNHPDIPDAGMGRIVRFKEPQSLSTIIDRIARGVGNPKGFPIAIPQGKTIGDITVLSVAICAGSGGSMFAGLDDIDLLFTGELSHHEALAAIERGQSVIALFHSNTERGFLHSVLNNQLLEKVKEEWKTIREDEKAREDLSEEYREILDDESVAVENSEKDRDPYGLVISKS